MILHPRFLVLLIACVVSNGCFAPRPVTFRVLDAETEKPIEGATATAEYEDIWIGYLAKIPVAPTEGTTGTDGKTLLLMQEPSMGIYFQKEGYLPYWGQGLHSEIPRWPFDAATIHLYSEAPPKVVVVVPDDYRGLLQIREHRPKRVQTHGDRYFEFHLTPGEVVELEGIPPSNSERITQTEVRYESGAVISGEFVGWHRARADEAVLRLVKRESEFEGQQWREDLVTYVIGNHDDWLTARRKLGLPEPPAPPGHGSLGRSTPSTR